MDLAIADDCDVHLASFGPIIGGFLATEVPDAARRYAAAIDAAVARGRCPNESMRLCPLGEPPNCVPLCATRFPDVELRSDDLFLVDRFLHVVYLLGHALIHGRTDQFDTNLGFLARYPNIPIARIWGDGLGAVRKVIDGDDLDERELQVPRHVLRSPRPIVRAAVLRPCRRVRRWAPPGRSVDQRAAPWSRR